MIGKSLRLRHDNDPPDEVGDPVESLPSELASIMAARVSNDVPLWKRRVKPVRPGLT